MKAAARRWSEDERSDVAKRVADEGLASAVACVRKLTGASSADAITVLQEIGTERGVVPPAPEREQLSAEIVAIGTFSAKIAPCLPYPAERYANVLDGSVVVAPVFETYSNTALTIALGACFGVDPWSFDGHAPLHVARVDRDALGAIEPDARESFEHLLEAGFAFFFYG